MSSFRTLAVSMGTILAGSLLLVGGCGGGDADSACQSVCDKQYTCGDIDSTKADQCRHKCDGDADQTQAALDKCDNASDILDAIDQCVGRACSDYEECLTTVPSCKGGGTVVVGGGNPCQDYNDAVDKASMGNGCSALKMAKVDASNCPSNEGSQIECAAGCLGKLKDCTNSAQVNAYSQCESTCQ